MRKLPPLNALRAFEAAARHLSITRAAEELRVTQGAVSRQVAVLETYFATKLFVRRHRMIELTANGRQLYEHLRNAFDLLHYSARQITSRGHDRTLRVKSPPTFAIRWFVPRMARLHALEPSLDVHLITSHQPVDFATDDVDIAIHWGREPPAGLVARKILGERLIPVCSPRIAAATHPLRTPSDLRHHTLLSSLYRPYDWQTWLAAAAVDDVDGAKGLRFESSSLSYQAAIDGAGVVVAQKDLVSDDIVSGRLVTPFPLEAETNTGYFLVRGQGATSEDKIAVFEKWILSEAEKPPTLL